MPGRSDRFGIVNAVFINGVGSHIFNYEDAYLKTILHPVGPAVSAILAFSEYHVVSIGFMPHCRSWPPVPGSPAIFNGRRG
ncbi:MmgE/PrpD family protein [Robbsia sp. Bb-Pol-6]|uniref:MmgE/PrpD family protein n=1 Tax=Robbsia betulipollinis TaxID=2981849 RepID=A0ABT3ZTQ6_9BURK|nr:MmgE/PrpD family protein [Robbsia betulipollinis]MCY0389300.1 MmgE/PrpD family protein [Robbsia betulipollinis]